MKTRSSTFDLDLDDPEHPERGDVMLGPRNAYRVLDARPVDSARWGNRWHLTQEGLGPYDKTRPPMPDPGGRHWHFVNGSRG